MLEEELGGRLRPILRNGCYRVEESYHALSNGLKNIDALGALSIGYSQGG